MACIAPAALMAVLLISYDYQRGRAQLVQNSVITARTIASIVDKEFGTVEATLFALATSPSLAANDFSAFQAQADIARHRQSVINIVLSDENGKQFINTLRPFGEPLPQRNIAPPLKRVNETGVAGISDLFIGPVSKRPVVAVGVPVRRGNDVAYSLSASISADLFGELLIQQNLPPDWIAVILDRSGTIVARSHDMQRLVGRKAAPSLLTRILKAPEEAFEGTTIEGTRVLSVFSRAADSQWTVAIGVPADKLSSALNRSIYWLIVAAIVLLGTSLALAALIGGRIARAVRGLAVPALALGAGKAVQVGSFNLREADEVGLALARASAMLVQAQYRANHDVLTGLANRALFKEMLNQRLALCRRNGTPLSVLFIDLDGFKNINDWHGHAIGDQLLQTVAQRFEEAIRESDVAARLGGDEFAIVLVDTPASKAAEVARKLIERLEVPHQFGSLTVQISASIGVAGFPDSGATSKALLHRADDGMYEAKAKGKGQVVVVTG